MTQIQHFWRAHKKIADANNLFLELVKDGMTSKELATNIKRRPELWGRFANWLKKLP